MFSFLLFVLFFFFFVLLFSFIWCALFVCFVFFYFVRVISLDFCLILSTLLFGCVQTLLMSRIAADIFYISTSSSSSWHISIDSMGLSQSVEVNVNCQLPCNKDKCFDIRVLELKKSLKDLHPYCMMIFIIQFY